jgi:N-acyl homoserine lactone hydrolase
MAADRVTAIRLVPLELGRLTMALDEITGEPDAVVAPVPAWVVEHQAGVVVFDTGMHPDLQRSSDRIAGVFDTMAIDYPEGEELTSRLTAAGYRPTDVTTAIISHLHFDHAGGTAELPDARLVVQASEWSAGHHPRLVEAGLYNPDDFDIGHDVELVDGVHDVFGDGSVVCIPTPGHTKGHQSLRVELPSGPLVLTSDCVYFGRMLDAMTVPAYGYDRDLQLASMRKLASLRDREGCRLLFGHDLAQFRSLPPAGLA